MIRISLKDCLLHLVGGTYSTIPDTYVPNPWETALEAEYLLNIRINTARTRTKRHERKTKTK